MVVNAIVLDPLLSIVIGSSPTHGAESIAFLSHERRGNAWRRIFFSLALVS